MQFLQLILATLDRNGIYINHVETRPQVIQQNAAVKLNNSDNSSNKFAVRFEIFMECMCTKRKFTDAAQSLCKNHHIKRFNIYNNVIGKNTVANDAKLTMPWFPRYISELDNCTHCITKYDPTTDPRHPGHGDNVYIERRAKLNAIALAYKHGDALPHVDYLENELSIWCIVYQKLQSLHTTYSCKEYIKIFKDMESKEIFHPDRIPKIAQVSEYLHRKTGFTLRPCGGLLSARDFLASLAFRVFQTTIYIRHHCSPHHSPEPDLIHEFLGHCPMFANPLIAQFSQEIGLLSLGATDEQIEQLATLYWFFIEFGLSRENGQLKAIGAGLLSSFGELMHACSDKPQHAEFNPETTALQEYQDSDYQPIYFVNSSINDALIKLRSYINKFERAFSTIYNPYTQSIEVVEHASALCNYVERIEHEMTALRLAAQTVA